MHIERPALVPSLLGILVWGLTGLIVAQDRLDLSSENSQSALRLRARLGTTRFDVGQVVTSVAWSPDGRFLATAIIPHRVALWDAKIGQRVWQKFSTPQSNSTVQFSSDGQILFHSGASAVSAFGVAKGKPVDLESIGGDSAETFAWVRRGQDRKQLILTQGKKASQKITLSTDERVDGFASFRLSPKQRYLATGSSRGQLTLWDVREGRRVRDCRIPKGSVSALDFRCDGKRLAIGGSLPGIYVFDVESGRRQQFLEMNRIVDALAFDPEGKRLVSAEQSQKSVKFWNLRTGKFEREFSHRLTRVQSIAFSPDGSRFVLAGSSGPGSGGLGIWNVADGEKQWEQPGHAGPVTKLVFSPDSRLLATGSSDETVCLWEVPSGNRLARLEGNAYSDLRFSPDGWMLGAAGEYGDYRIWEVSSQDLLMDRGEVRNTNYTRKSCFSPELDRLALGLNHGQLRVIETVKGKERPPTQVFENREFGSVAFSPDGEWLAVASGPGFFKSPPQDKLMLWNLSQNKAGRELTDPILERNRNRYDGFESLHVSPDGRTLAAIHSHQIHSHQLSLWELSQGRRLHQKPISPERFIAFTPDGKTLLRLSMSDSSPGSSNRTGRMRRPGRRWRNTPWLR